jgi:hypothetical protein
MLFGLGNSSQDSILKNLSQKRAGGVAQGVGSECKSQYCKKKKKKKGQEESFSCKFSLVTEPFFKQQFISMTLV